MDHNCVILVINKSNSKFPLLKTDWLNSLKSCTLKGPRNRNIRLFSKLSLRSSCINYSPCFPTQGRAVSFREKSRYYNSWQILFKSSLPLRQLIWSPILFPHHPLVRAPFITTVQRNTCCCEQTRDLKNSLAHDKC